MVHNVTEYKIINKKNSSWIYKLPNKIIIKIFVFPVLNEYQPCFWNIKKIVFWQSKAVTVLEYVLSCTALPAESETGRYQNHFLSLSNANYCHTYPSLLKFELKRGSELFRIAFVYVTSPHICMSVSASHQMHLILCRHTCWRKLCFTAIKSRNYHRAIMKDNDNLQPIFFLQTFRNRKNNCSELMRKN